MTDNVKGFTLVNVSYSYLVLILEIQRPVIEWLEQIGTGRPTSSKTMLWWMDNTIDSKMVAYFVCNYKIKYFTSNTCNRYKSVIWDYLGWSFLIDGHDNGPFPYISDKGNR